MGGFGGMGGGVLVVVVVGRRKGVVVWVWGGVLQVLEFNVEGYGSGYGDILDYR